MKDLKDCSTTFSEEPKSKRLETLKNVMLKSIDQTARKSRLPQHTVMRAHSALKDFLNFLDPETLELRYMTSKEMSLYKFAHFRQSFLELEALESKLLNTVDSQTFIKEFLHTYYYKKSRLPDHLNKFFRHYVNRLSFRRDVYKIELFLMLFKNIFLTLSPEQISALLPSTESQFLKKQTMDLFHDSYINDPKDMKMWRIRLHEFIERYDEIQSDLVK